MKDEPVPLSGKSSKERFYELGAKLMAVPKAEVDERDKKWQATKRRKQRKR